MTTGKRLATVGDVVYAVDAHGRDTRVSQQPDGPDTTVATQYLGHGRLLLTQDGRRRPAWVTEDGHRRWVFCDGEVVVVDFGGPAARGARRPSPPGLDTLCALMPATVVRVLAPPGTHVASGATVLLLEAMKMELPLRAPHDAVVRAVHCREGELVQPDVPLIELDALAPTGEA